jgi:MoxR-like ATPase
MFKLVVSYPARGEERAILDRMTDGPPPTARPVLDPRRVLQARTAVQGIYVDGRIKDYVLNLVAATRVPASAGLAELAPLIEYGASPRAAIFLVRAAKGQAFLAGRGYVVPEDIKAVAADVLRHRLIPTYRADAEAVTTDQMVARILETVPVP